MANVLIRIVSIASIVSMFSIALACANDYLRVSKSTSPCYTSTACNEDTPEEKQETNQEGAFQDSKLSDLPKRWLPESRNALLPITVAKLKLSAFELADTQPLGSIYIGLWGITARHGIPAVRLAYTDNRPSNYTPFHSAPAPFIVARQDWEGEEGYRSFGYDTYYLWLFNRIVLIGRRPYERVNPYW